MEVYFTSKNTAPMSSFDPTFLMYVGGDLEKAIEAVGQWTQFELLEEDFPTQGTHMYAAIPPGQPRKMVKFYADQGYWYSIVSIEVKPGLKFQEGVEYMRDSAGRRILDLPILDGVDYSPNEIYGAMRKHLQRLEEID